MDYVLFGMGYGATLMLLGWALRTFGPERKYKDIDQSETDLIVQQRNWVRFIQGLGGVIAIAGSVLVALTFVVMLINPSDETGGVTAVVVWALLVVAVLIWCWFYVGKFGVAGLWAKPQSNKSSLTSRMSAPTTQSSEIPAVPSMGPAMVEPASTLDLDDGSLRESSGSVAGEPAPDSIEKEVSGESAPEPPDFDVSAAESLPEAVSAEPEYDFGDSSDTTVPSDTGGRSEAIRRLRERQARTSRNQG